MNRAAVFQWLSLLFVWVVASAAAQDGRKMPLSQTFASPECHVRFNYPADWDVVAGLNCRFRIQQSKSKKIDEIATEGITISVSDGPLDKAAQKAGFALRDGKWMFRGEREVTADPIKIGRYKGLMVDDFPCRIYDKNGYVGMGDCAAAIVGSSRRAASFYANPESMELLPRIVQSFRFDYVRGLAIAPQR